MTSISKEDMGKVEGKGPHPRGGAKCSVPLAKPTARTIPCTERTDLTGVWQDEG